MTARPKEGTFRSEAWRPVPVCQQYEVSDIGSVRRVAAGQGACVGRRIKWGKHTSNGYPDVRLTVNNKQHRYNVHVLVALAFLGPRQDGMVVRHLDGNKWNPSVENLAYGTVWENSQDDIAHGKTLKGERNGNSRLTADKIANAIHRYRDGETVTGLAKEYGVHRSSLFRAFAGKSWRHIHT